MSAGASSRHPRHAAVRDSVIVVALGGNAIARFGDDGSIDAQARRAAEAAARVCSLVREGAGLVITHGNGPVIGDIVLRGEIARGIVRPTPLYIAGADSEGGIGLLLQQALHNELRRRALDRTVATLVTQVVVDPSDPAFERPTKPIGPYHDHETARRLAAESGWEIAEEPGRGYRRVVASPRPVRVVETAAVRALLDAGVIAIAAGGGGVPVVERDDGTLEGVDAVVDKDWSSALLAAELGAGLLVVLMEADAVYRDFGSPGARRIAALTPEEAAALARALPAGSVGPKVGAAGWFAARGGTAVICRAEDLEQALRGDAGTTVSPAM